MPQEVRGVISRAPKQQVEMETIVIPDPGPGEVIVDIRACGVCHTDLHYREGAVGNDFPFLLGHEAAGTIEEVGPSVTDVAPGDYVVIAWRAPCGSCRSCLRGRPWYCFDSRNATQRMTLTDGTPLTPALGIGAFCDKTLVAAGQAVKIDPRARPEAAGLIGCGIMAGFGAAANTAQVERGETVAVFGCGGVGNAAIAAAALAGARTVIGVDLNPAKLKLARKLGATDVVDASQGDVVDAIKAFTDGYGVDVAIDAVGHPAVFEQAYHARDLAGRLVLVGVPDPTMTYELPLQDFFGRGGAIKPSWYGDCLPTRDFPHLIDLYMKGLLDLDAFVSETIGIDEIEAAFDKMHSGEVLRSVVVI
jgi:S-(hydroxymethyl)mycothiol dehydrogenase